MSNYYFLDWFLNEEGDFEFVFDSYHVKGLLLIADSPYNYSIYRVSSINENNLPKGIEKLSLELITLLQSSEGYRPAIALAREEVNKICDRRNPIQKKEFSNLYTEIVKKYLLEQPYKNYFLAEFLLDSSDDFSLNEFVWIIGYDSTNDFVKCVDSLYFTHMYPAKYFRFDRKYLNNLS